MIRRIRFQEYTATAVKTIMVDGKKRRRQKTFRETQSPFNKNEQGFPKTVEEIYASLKSKVEAWEAEDES